MKKKNKLSFNVIKNIVFIGEFLIDKTVSFFEKFKVVMLLLLSIMYFFIPIDIIPDVFFGMGWIEDGAIILATLIYISDRIDKNRNKIEQKPIDNNIIDVDFTEVKPK